MFIRHLSLTNFRNYSDLELKLDPSLIVVQGDNAQGKTNLLEAILILSTTKSHRATSDRDLVFHYPDQESQTFTRLLAEVQKKRDSVKVEVALIGNTSIIPNESTATSVRKRIRINGIARRAVDLVGQVNAVIFSSQDMDLICGNPSLCRRYVDIVNSQIDPYYLKSLQRYQKVLIQRNHLLRMIQEKKARIDQLEFWDNELIGNGSYIIRSRYRLIDALNELARGIHNELSGNKERLEIVYITSVGKEEENSDDIESLFHQRLHRLRGREIGQGVTLTGPHRDSLQFNINEDDVGKFGSRGQQRTSALSLKLAEAEYLRNQSGDSPILLLDDVLSELDQKRCQHLLEFVLPYQQVLITTTDTYRFDPSILARSTQLEVKQGIIRQV